MGSARCKSIMALWRVIAVLNVFSLQLRYPVGSVPVPVNQSQTAYDRIATINRNSTSALFEGDIIYNQLVEDVLKEDQLVDVARDVVRNREHLWVTRVVPYVLAKEYTSDQQTLIKNAMKAIEKETCIRFKEHTKEPIWLNVVKQKGCISMVGRDFQKPGAQPLSLADDCLETGIILHELMHSLGFWHEQSRPDRDSYVEIFWENMEPGIEQYFKKYSHKEADLLGTPYDYMSVMHYSRTSGSKNGKPTIVAIGNKDLELGNSGSLTATDVLEINRLYECEKAKNHTNYISSWTEYGPCDNRCNKKRQRFCTNEDLSKCPNVNVHGIEEEVIKCTEAECYAPIDGHWGRWSQWGDCIPECGPRRQTRLRQCNNPKPKYGGKSCAGESKMSQGCPSKSCSFACNFDNGWCGWSNFYTNTYRFKWLIIKGQTFSKNTGPDGDHTTGDGYYLFVEASSPALEGDKARIISKTRSAALQGECISFWYNMFGKHIGKLRVFLKYQNGEEKQIWVDSGDKGNKWIKGNATAYSSMPYQVIFEAERGNGYLGDIAIDDVNIEAGKCDMNVMEKLTGIKMTPVGCYSDSTYDRVLPELLATNRNFIDWFKYTSSLARILKNCAEKAKSKGYTYIGIQYYGECWSGPSHDNIFKHGPSKSCVNGMFNECLKPKEELCTGKSLTNFIYKLI